MMLINASVCVYISINNKAIYIVRIHQGANVYLVDSSEKEWKERL